MSADFQLYRNAFGQLVLVDSKGILHVGVTPVRAFPIIAPQEGVSLMNREGHEVVWIENMVDLADSCRDLVNEELRSREFMPEIDRIVKVSGFATPCTWVVETDRGVTSFVLKAEEDIRRLAAPSLLIVDKRGIQFLVRDPQKLDDVSRKILMRFL